MQTEDLFAGDPAVIEINDVIDELRETQGGADLYHLTRGDPRLAAAALAAYTRQLPQPLLCTPHVEALFQALNVEDYAHRVAALRDTCAEMPEANLAVLHRLCHFLNRLGDSRTCVPGNEMAALALFWSAMLMPPAGSTRTRAHRVKEYRVVALLLQQSHCVFEGALETHELPELPLPPHLADGIAQEEAQRKQWIKIKASLLRDTRGQFKISLHEDDGGIYLNRIERSDVSDDRDRLASHDYLVSINRKPIEELSLSGVKDVVKHAKAFLELEVRRYAGEQASDYERQQQEERRRREEAQLRRYQEQMNSYVSGAPPPQQQPPVAARPQTGMGRDEYGRPTGGGSGAHSTRMQGFGPGEAPRRQACNLSSLPSAASSAPPTNGRDGFSHGHGAPYGGGGATNGGGGAASGGGGGGGGTWTALQISAAWLE